MSDENITVVSLPPSQPAVRPALFAGQPVLGVTTLGQPDVAAVSIIQGPPGPPGPPGATPTVISLTDVSDWNYTHDYPYLPEVRLVDSTGYLVGVGVEYPSPSTIYIQFPVPFTGSVLLT